MLARSIFDTFFHLENLKLLERWNGLSTHAVDSDAINYFDNYIPYGSKFSYKPFILEIKFSR